MDIFCTSEVQARGGNNSPNFMTIVRYWIYILFRFVIYLIALIITFFFFFDEFISIADVI